MPGSGISLCSDDLKWTVNIHVESQISLAFVGEDNLLDFLGSSSLIRH